MLFKSKSMQVDYLPSKQITMYLKAKLKEFLNHDYEVYTFLSISQNWVDITIDESTMSDLMYEDLMLFKEKNNLGTGRDVFSKFLEMNKPGSTFKFLVSDLDGVYVIRES